MNKDPLACAPAMPRTLLSGQLAEARALDALQMAKNTDVWRPTSGQIESPAFREIVGRPLFTARGLARGTVIDSVQKGFAEIKSGASVLGSTYQLRLQAYRSVVEDRTFKLFTSRPLDTQFARWLRPLGVKVRPLPGPEP
jgi:hypothetical protein